jgi:hypothetical protein
MFVCGAMIGSLGAAHTIAVINQALRRPAFQYDFRLYSLILLGIFLIAGGVRCLTTSWKVSRGDARAWKDALQTTTMLLAVNLPLTPIQGFAAGLAGFLVVTLFVLIATRHSFVARLDAPPAKATEIAEVVVNLAP